MTQFIAQSLSQQMRMEQRLTPQLIQSMAILQKPVADLETHINDMLESNAALEVAEPEPNESTDGQSRDDVRESRDGRMGPSETDRFARFDRYSRDCGLDAPDSAPFPARRISQSGERDAKMGALANAAGREISLHEYLLDQWGLLELEEEITRGGKAMINSLDPDGYLRMTLEAVADSVRPPLALETVEQALLEVQRLEPTGIGARDVVECLLLQLDTLPGDNRMERTLIEKHLSDLMYNRLPAISKETGYSIGEINEAIRAMRSTLTLHPGYLIGDRSTPPIRPDVIVEYAGSGGGLTVRLSRGNVPELRIRDDVLAMSKSHVNGKNTQEFARKQVDAASALIDAITFRRNRLLEVSQAIVEQQRDFMDVGPEGLKTFRMSDLAVELGCDPSTISRTVSDKYMQTPRGIFPLRYFFTGGPETETGESMGWDRVKARTAELIEAEDPGAPLNDDKIAALLKREGIDISRRTVAKYRQLLEIPNARQRRKYS